MRKVSKECMYVWKVSTLSGHSQLICFDGVGVLGQLSTQVTDTGCFPKGLRLAVTSDVPVILHYS